MKTLTCTFTENLNRIATGCINHIKIILTLTLLLLSQQTHAAAPSSGITYTGRILDSSDQPVTASQVYFTITISDPDQKCWLYTEQRLVDMSTSSGNFSFEVGSNDPTTLYGTPSLNNPLGGGPATFADVFDNSKSFTSLAAGSYTCPGGTYNPATSTDKYEGRVMAIFFRIGAAGTDQALPALRITPVPLAMQSINSVKVNGYDKNHLLRIDTSIASPVNSDINATQLAEFFRLVNNPGTAYISSIPSMGGDVTGTVAANTVAKIQNVAVSAPTTGDTGKVLTYNGTGMVWSAASAGGITTLNGLSTSTQSFVVGNSGTDFNISSSGSGHTFNIPTASSSNRGLLSTTDWTAFNGKQSSALGSGQVWIGNASGAAQAQTLSGDATVSASGNVTVDKTQAAAASKILQLDSSGNAYVAGVDIKGTGTGEAQLRFTGATDMVMNLPTTSGTANQFLQTDGAGNLSWASQSAMLPTISSGQVWVGNSSNGAQAFSLSGDIASVSSTGLVTLSTSATGSNKLPLAGGTMSGAIAMGGNNITNAGDVSLAAGKFLGLGAGSTAGTVAGQVWYDGGIIKYFDGTTTQSLGVAGAGITNLNGLSAGTQSFVNGFSGTTPAFSSAGSAHTLNIPMASSASVTAGLISNADYASMMAKQSGSLAAGQVWVGNASGVAQAFALSGDISSVSNTGSVVVNKTTTGQANYILALDGSGIANVKGLDVQSGTGKVTFLTNGAFTNYTLTLPNVSPAANQIMKSDASGNLSWVTYLANVSDSAPLTNGKMWIGNASGIASEVTMSGDATITSAGLLTLKNTGTVGTYTKVITDAQGRVTSGSALASGDVTTALGYTPVNRAGDSMTGDLTTQNLNIVAGKFLGLGAGSTAGTTAGQMWYDSGVIKYFDGTTTQSLGVAGAGITSLNGLTSNTQSFVIGSAGNSPAMTSTGSAHTLDIPMASASGSVTAGLISNADYASMMAKQSNALADSSVWVGNASGAAQARALSGDITISNVGLVTANKTTTAQANKLLSLDGSSVGTMNGLALVNTGTVTLQAGTASSTYSLSLPSASPTGNQIMQVSSTGVLSWVSNAANVNNAASLTDGKLWLGNSGNVAVEVAMSGDATISNAGLLTLKNTGTIGTYSKVITDAQGRVTSGSALAAADVTTALGYTPVNKAGDTMSGSLILAAGQYLGLGSGSTAGTVAGQIWYDSGVVKYFDGTTTKALGVAGAGITNLNGLTTGTQSFVIGSAGNSPAITSAGSAHTLDIPMASASGSVTAGLISNADYASIMSKQSNSLTDSFVWIGNGSNGAQARALSGDVTISNVGLVTLKSVGTAGTYSKVITDAQGRVTSGSALAASDITTALGYTPVNKAGDTMSGDLNTQNINVAAGKFLGLGAGSTAGTAAGQMWYDSGVIKYFDGTTTKSLGVAGSGITSLNGLTSNTQSFVNGTAGTAPAFSSAGSAHTLDIPMASAASVTAGLISKTDYDAFNSKQSSALTEAYIWVGNVSGGAVARALTGDVAGVNNIGSVTIVKTTTAESNKILALDGSGVANVAGLGVKGSVSGNVAVQAAGTTANYSITLPSTSPTANQIMQSDASGNLSWVSNAANVNNAASLTDGKFWIGNGSNIAVERTLSGDATISNVGLLTLKNTGTAGTYFKVITDAQGRVSSGSALAAADITAALTYTPVNKAGDTMSGSLMLAAGQYLGLGSGSTAGTVAGQMWYDSGTIKYFDGTTTKALGVAGSGITSLNGLTGSSQTFATPGTSGTAPAWSFAGSTHTLNIPLAATASVTAGLVSNADYTSMMAKQSNSLTDGSIWIGNGSNGAQARALSGDATISNVGLVTLKSVGTAGTYWKVVTDAQGRVTSGSALASGDVTTALGFTPASATSGFVNGGNSFTGNATIGLNDAYTLGFETSGTTQMTLTAAGNLGIGTATPISKVQVHSTANSDNAVSVSVSGSGNAQKAKLDLVTLADSSALGASSGNRGWSMTAYGNSYSTSDANDLDFSYWGGATWTQGLRLAQDGNVGIGTSSPAYSLDFNSRTDGIRLPAGNASQRPTNAAGVFRYNTSTNTVEFYNGSAWTTLASTTGTMTNSLTSGTVWIGNGSGVAQERALSGDITISNVGLVTADKTTTGTANKLLALDGTGVTNVKGLDIQTGTGKVTLQTSGAFTNYVLTLPTSSGATNQVLSNTGGGALGWATVLSASGINNTASLAAAKIWVGNASGVAVAQSPGGDVTMDNAGSFTLNTVTVAKGGTGQTSLTSGSILVGNGTAGIGTLAGGTTGNVIYATSASAWGSGTPDTAGLIDKTSNQTSGITGNKTFSGYTVVSNGSFSSTGIALGATTLSVSTGNGSIGTGSGGTSTGGGGQIYAAAYDNTAGATIDFNKGNVQTTSYDCGGNVTLNNMQSGGSYTLIVTGTGTTKCTLYDGGTLIPDARFAPTNAARTASSATIYTMIKVGTKVYVSWIPGFSP